VNDPYTACLHCTCIGLQAMTSRRTSGLSHNYPRTYRPRQHLAAMPTAVAMHNSVDLLLCVNASKKLQSCLIFDIDMATSGSDQPSDGR